MYDVMIIGSGVSGSAAAERQKPIVELCTQDMMQKRVH